MGQYSGAWVRATSGPFSVPLVAPIDPEHSKPSADPNIPAGQPYGWQDTTAQPGLPDALLGVQGEQSPTTGGGAVVDQTPLDHSDGVGIGHGQTPAQASRVRGATQGEDDGAVAAYNLVPNVDRDGAPHVAVIEDTPGRGDSPDTLALERTGVGSSHDPGARTAHRIKRWYDRHIDRHAWGAEMRSHPVRNARTMRAQVAPDPATQIYPPTTWRGQTMQPDNFTAAQTRHTPTPWDESTKTDPGPASVYGLTTWGL